MTRGEAKAKILGTLTRHIGIEKAIGMGELWVEVFGESWHHRINDTRLLRKLIEEMRYDGYLVGDIRTRNGGGYYLVRSSHELGSWFQRREKEWKKKAFMLSRMKKLSLDEYLGQSLLNLRGGSNGVAAARE